MHINVISLMAKFVLHLLHLLLAAGWFTVSVRGGPAFRSIHRNSLNKSYSKTPDHVIQLIADYRRLGDFVIQVREKAIEKISEWSTSQSVSRRQQEIDAALSAHPHKNKILGNTKLALLEHLLSHIHHPDVHLVNDIVRGFSPVQSAAGSGGFFGSLTEKCENKNAKKRKLRRDADLLEWRFDKPHCSNEDLLFIESQLAADRENGICSGFFTHSEILARKPKAISYAFAVHQPTEKDADKMRVCMDDRIKNLWCESQEKITLEDARV